MYYTLLIKFGDNISDSEKEYYTKYITKQKYGNVL